MYHLVYGESNKISEAEAEDAWKRIVDWLGSASVGETYVFACLDGMWMWTRETDHRLG
jgi:hypothetical protein